MIKNLKRRFIAITMGAIFAVFAVVLITLNLFMQRISTNQIDALLETIAANDELLLIIEQRSDGGSIELYDPRDESFLRVGRFFYVRIVDAGEQYFFSAGGTSGITQDMALEYAQKVLKKGVEKGTIDEFQYLVAQKPDNSYIIVFAERSIELQLLSKLRQVSLWVAGGSCVVLLIIVVLLGRWAVRPVEQSLEKQRRFISDASHELKTPLTIISANADVLESEIGQNQWLGYIKQQTMRMGRLIQDLLSLTRTDEGIQQIQFASFSFSDMVLNTILEFESRVFEEGRHLQYDIQENIACKGDEKQLRQVLVILVDNAILHSPSDGQIRVKLKKHKEKIVLSVYNTGTGIAESEREKIFERFYRSDTSRSRETGGYGLGLSIAKSIVEKHKGKIIVTGKEGAWVQFTVTL